MDIAPALKQIVDKLEFIAKLNQKCNEIAVCCDLYAPELQVTYKFNKIKSYNNNIYYIKRLDKKYMLVWGTGDVLRD